MKKVLLITLLLVCTACSGRLKKSENDADPAVGDPLAELQTNVPIYVPSLISAFGTTGNYGGSGFLAFYNGNRYFSGIVKEVSTKRFQMMAVVGTYTETGGIVTTTPKKSTCPSWVAYSRTVNKSMTGNPSSTVVTITTNSTTITLPKLNPAGSAPSGVVLEWGCFDMATGVFTTQAWSNI